MDPFGSPTVSSAHIVGRIRITQYGSPDNIDAFDFPFTGKHGQGGGRQVLYTEMVPASGDRIEQGDSGGGVFADNQLVGVNYAIGTVLLDFLG